MAKHDQTSFCLRPPFLGTLTVPSRPEVAEPEAPDLLAGNQTHIEKTRLEKTCLENLSKMKETQTQRPFILENTTIDKILIKEKNITKLKSTNKNEKKHALKRRALKRQALRRRARAPMGRYNYTLSVKIHHTDHAWGTYSSVRVLVSACLSPSDYHRDF